MKGVSERSEKPLVRELFWEGMFRRRVLDEDPWVIPRVILRLVLRYPRVFPP